MHVHILWPIRACWCCTDYSPSIKMRSVCTGARIRVLNGLCHHRIEQGVLVVYALHDITRGEELVHIYAALLGNKQIDRQERRAALKKTWGFVCRFVTSSSLCSWRLGGLCLGRCIVQSGVSHVVICPVYMNMLCTECFISIFVLGASKIHSSTERWQHWKTAALKDGSIDRRQHRRKKAMVRHRPSRVSLAVGFTRPCIGPDSSQLSLILIWGCACHSLSRMPAEPCVLHLHKYMSKCILLHAFYLICFCMYYFIHVYILYMYYTCTIFACILSDYKSMSNCISLHAFYLICAIPAFITLCRHVHSRISVS